MLKVVKRVFIILVILTVFALVGIFVYSNGRTYFNEDNEEGNTTGNIYNGGLFCEQDGTIYFSNDSDDGSLYSMNSDCTDVKKIYDDKAVFINADENYLYYVRANNTRENKSSNILMFYNTGVFRITQNGRNLKSYTGNPGAYLTLKGNHIYFQRYDVEIGLYLYRYQIDGKLERLLIEDAIIPAAIMDNTLYYAGYSENHNINAMNLSSFTTHSIYDGSFYYPIFMGNDIYYLDLEDNYKIYRMNQDGSDPVLLVNDRCSTYNITNSGQYLYYQVDNGENNHIGRLNLETMENETIMEGNYKQIHVTNNYVFFKDFDNTNTYLMSADGALNVSTFNPPNLNED